ncbi:hypothetical protein FOXYSP1_03971 [Fusarium oxysporum f. sp. phaseoli]
MGTRPASLEFSCCWSSVLQQGHRWTTFGSFRIFANQTLHQSSIASSTTL